MAACPGCSVNTATRTPAPPAVAAARWRSGDKNNFCCPIRLIIVELFFTVAIVTGNRKEVEEFAELSRAADRHQNA